MYTFARFTKYQQYSRKYTISSGKLSTFNPWVIGLASELCKWFVILFSRTRIHGMENLESLLTDPIKRDGRPIITFSNHISTIDDPIMWGWISRKISYSFKDARWVLGAQEITFPSPIVAFFSSRAKILPIVRGLGLQQPGMLMAKEAIYNGDWLHVFPEGRVNMTSSAILTPLRWGTSQLIIEYYLKTNQLPHIVPIVLKGIDNVLPYTSRIKIPRLFKSIEIAIGESMSESIKNTRLLENCLQVSKEYARSMITRQLASKIIEIHSKLYCNQINFT